MHYFVHYLHMECIVVIWNQPYGTMVMQDIQLKFFRIVWMLGKSRDVFNWKRAFFILCSLVAIVHNLCQVKHYYNKSQIHLFFKCPSLRSSSIFVHLTTKLTHQLYISNYLKKTVFSDSSITRIIIIFIVTCFVDLSPSFLFNF